MVTPWMAHAFTARDKSCIHSLNYAAYAPLHQPISRYERRGPQRVVVWAHLQVVPEHMCAWPIHDIGDRERPPHSCVDIFSFEGRYRWSSFQKTIFSNSSGIEFRGDDYHKRRNNTGCCMIVSGRKTLRHGAVQLVGIYIQLFRQRFLPLGCC
jgi:hypothetical protein